MSEKNATHTRDIIHDVNVMENRILKLEKKISRTEWFEPMFMPHIIDLLNKISELEKKVEWNGEQIVHAFDSLTEKHSMIAELREYMRNQWAKMEFNQTNLQNQLNELKSGGEKEEVMVLSKAEKPSPSSVVRKEVATSTHSKHPDPFVIAGKIDLEAKPSKPILCEHGEHYINLCKKCERLPDATGIEPREDDKINTLHKIKMMIKLEYPELRIVKREDLDFLYEYCNDQGIYDERLQTVFWDELKRIVEEYNL